MSRLKLVEVYEKDYETPKQNIYGMNYDNVRGEVFSSYLKLEVGGSGLFYDVSSNKNNFRTSTIERIFEDGNMIDVVTLNSIYHFEAIEEAVVVTDKVTETETETDGDTTTDQDADKVEDTEVKKDSKAKK